MMNQTRAIFLDAYRDLNARKMFWTVMSLNVLAVLCFALFGANQHALTFLWYEPFGNFFTAVDYKKLYSNVVVGFWFTWVATILALISTAGVFPDLMTSGSIDLYLAKPISRLRLFLTKYLASLMFVTLQVIVFTTLSFLALGIRGGVWEPGLFWAIPLVVLFFSYLYGICVLLGIFTRSTIAALLLTLLVWGGIFCLDFVDRKAGQAIFIMNALHDSLPAQIDAADARIAVLKANATEAGSQPATDAAASAPADDVADSELARLTARRASLIEQRDRGIVPGALSTAEHVLFDVKSFVPKTRETLALMDRFLFNDKDLKDAAKFAEPDLNDSTQFPGTAPAGRGPMRRGPQVNQGVSTTLIQAQLDRDRSIWWIIGTSLLFEAACLALAAWRFCTRDF